MCGVQLVLDGAAVPRDSGGGGVLLVKERKLPDCDICARNAATDDSDCAIEAIATFAPWKGMDVY